jgi:hypothetical protein
MMMMLMRITLKSRWKKIQWELRSMNSKLIISRNLRRCKRELLDYLTTKNSQRSLMKMALMMII